MITLSILFSILIIVIIGFIQVFNRHKRIVKNIEFAREYRNKFVDFSNKYFEKYDSFHRSGHLDNELYVWLTMNVSRIENLVGHFGIISYKPAFQNYMINNYQVIINTIPKFREKQVQSFDVNAVDDCLLRYLGYLEEYNQDTHKNLKNPIIWFREGFREVLSIPIFMLNWFGLISSSRLNSIKESLIYKVISGLIALITLTSAIVTIIVGYDQTIEFVNRFFEK